MLRLIPLLKQSLRRFTPDTLSSYKRGAGGRSSFNGVVATIFGGNGFVGEALVNYLGREGTQMIIAHRCDMQWIDTFRVYGDLGQILLIKYQPNDIDDANLYKSMKYSNVVINLIGSLIETKNYTFEETHIEIPRKLARIAKECGVSKFVQMSHFGANPYEINGPTLLNPKKSHKFLKTKGLGEEAVLSEFPNATIIKPATIFGFNDRFFNLYGSDWRHSGDCVALWKKGEETIKAPVYVYDVCKAIGKIVSPLMPLEAVAGKRFYLTGPYAYTLAELCDWMHQLMHYEPEVMDYQRKELDLGIWIKTVSPQILRWMDDRKFTPAMLELEFVNEEMDPRSLGFADLGIQERTDVNSLGSFCLLAYRSDRTFDRYYAGDFFINELPPVEYPPPRALYRT